jgi:hypothetical protein
MAIAVISKCRHVMARLCTRWVNKTTAVKQHNLPLHALTPAVLLSSLPLREQVTVPEVEPHDPSEGILHDPSTNVRVLPTIYPEFVRRRAQLLSPSSTHPLEADRPYNFVVIAPGKQQRRACTWPRKLASHHCISQHRTPHQ